MSVSLDAERCVINETTQIPTWSEFGSDVRKIVVGTSPSGRSRDDSKLLTLTALPDDLATRFPQLTHLYLWQISQLQQLPELPPGMVCLDVRNCPDLEELANLPAGLETLVIENCPHFVTQPDYPDRFEHLTDLSVAGSAFKGEQVDQLLACCPNLTRFDASNCLALDHVSEWPAKLDRIDLNNCTKLDALPPQWPMRLRRLGLRGCSRLSRIADFPDTIDYVDLAYAENLTELPDRRQSPRTLFLFQSGILMPPSSEHGGSKDDNVARRTQSYFEDVESFGPGNVRRCKLLILGNGSAGKTCLAGSLVTDKPQQHEPDSTHGIQFWDWQFTTKISGMMQPIHLHLWDFGGQEIYHNTHRLFMSKGAVFVLVWNPHQDDKIAPLSASEYQDEWRPLRYWIDTIYAACPHKPRIAILCSHQTEKNGELCARLRKQIGDEYYEQHPRFFHDSADNVGEKDDLVKWLKQEVGDVVRTQGTAVPVHWEIAQDMVESWLPKTESGSHDLIKPEYNRLRPVEFGKLLYDRIIAVTTEDREEKYAQLKKAIDDGQFELTDDRITRTLEFLTHSGWAYWNQNLFEGQVIIGQNWALNAIYAVLDRREDSNIYRQLCKSHGQFTRQDLTDWIWRDDYDRIEQELLISFMESVGVIFRLVTKDESYWHEPVYKSFEHLPKSDTLQFRRKFDPLPDDQKHVIPIESDKLHKGDWQALLKNMGESYGTDAQYAIDGFFLRNSKDQHTYWIKAELEENILGGKLVVQVAGPEATERCESVAEHVRSFLPDRRGDRTRGERGRTSVAGEPPGHTQVFFTYAWDAQDGTIPAGYEKPVDALYQALLAEPTIEPLRDKYHMFSGDSITLFMDRIKKADKVLVIHSDKYWKSWFCMHEFSTAVERREEFADFLILISHINSDVDVATRCQEYVSFWAGSSGFPTMLEDVTTEDKLKAAILHALKNQMPAILGTLDIGRKWDDASAEEVIAWVKHRLGLPKSGE